MHQYCKSKLVLNKKSLSLARLSLRPRIFAPVKMNQSHPVSLPVLLLKAFSTLFGLSYRLGVWLCGVLCLLSVSLYAQDDSLKQVKDPKWLERDSLSTDSLQKVTINTAARRAADTTRPAREESDIETTIDYTAKDSIITNMFDEVVYLYGNAVVVYGDMKIEANVIEIDWRNDLVKARGTPDSTGKMRGTPVFTQQGDVFESQEMTYNFKTKKGLINGVVTQQGEGYIYGAKVKKSPENEMYLSSATYTTCNLSTPHFHIQSRKIKMVPDKAVIAGPFNLFINQKPTPLGFLFGIFPFSETRRSGIIVPVYGEDAARGFFLRQGGYYWSVNDNIAAEFLGELYTNGSWGVDFGTTYRKRYYYDGGARVRYNKRLQQETDLSQTEIQDFWVEWRHSPTPRGNGAFNANVNFGTTSFNANNSFNPMDYVSNNFQSSVSYRYAFGSVANLSLAARTSQNTQSGETNVILPNFNFAVNRFFPFKPRGASPKGWLQNINLSYGVDGVYQVNNTFTSPYPFTVANPRTQADGTPFDPNQRPDFFENFDLVRQNAQVGAVHNIPISTTIKFFKYLQLNPSFNYQEYWYPYRLDYTWVSEQNAVRVDTINQFSRAFNYNLNANFTTRLYGTVLFRDKKRLEGIRHTLVPTIGLSYSPDLSSPSFDFYQNVQVDSTGRVENLSRYLGFIRGFPGGSEAANINYSLNNIFEMKIRPKGDSAAKAEKVPLLENISISGAYNILADSLNFSNINIAARTRLIGLLDVNVNANVDPYMSIGASNTDGTLRPVRVNRLALLENAGLGYINNVSMGVNTNLTPTAFKKKEQEKRQQLQEEALSDPRMRQVLDDPTAYVDFDIPWTLNVSFTYSLNRLPFQEKQEVMTFNFGGNLSLTPTWKLAFSSGYDFVQKDLAFTTIDIIKDLHCWEMRFNWIPFGVRQSYNFDIYIKASILQDLKISRRRSWYDRPIGR